MEFGLRNWLVPTDFRGPTSAFVLRSAFRVPHPAFALLLLALVCLASAGCFNAATLVKVQPDGSGTIEQTLSMRADAAEQLQAMMAGFGGEHADASDSKKDAKPLELFSEQDMRDAAPKLGEGVTFVSSTPINADGRVGRVAIYTFADISKLRVDEKPATPGAAGSMARSGPPEEIRFGFAKLPNGHSQVTIAFPEAQAPPKDVSDAAAAAARKTPDPAQREMIKKMLDGLKIAVNLEVAGPIVKTNSPYVQGNRVTLLEMDFTQVLADDRQLAQLSQPASLEEVKQALKNIKGFKVNLEKEVTIEFAGQ